MTLPNNTPGPNPSTALHPPLPLRTAFLLLLSATVGALVVLHPWLALPIGIAGGLFNVLDRAIGN